MTAAEVRVGFSVAVDTLEEAEAEMEWLVREGLTSECVGWRDGWVVYATGRHAAESTPGFNVQGGAILLRAARVGRELAEVEPDTAKVVRRVLTEAACVEVDTDRMRVMVRRQSHVGGVVSVLVSYGDETFGSTGKVKR